MMDEPRLRVALGNGPTQGRQRELRRHVSGQMPADTAARVRIQNAGQVDEGAA